MKYKITKHRATGRMYFVWNVERWENGRFAGGLTVKDKKWQDPMIGEECDFRSVESASLALLQSHIFQGNLEIDA